MNNDEILDEQRKIANGINQKLNAIQRPGTVSRATELLLTRIFHSVDSLTVLCNNSPHMYLHDAAMILRGVYDAMLQTLYILWKPEERENRAELYLDYYWVERYKFIQIIDRNQTPLAKILSSSPKRAESEPEIMEYFEKVKNKYLTKTDKLQAHGIRAS